MFTTLSSAFNWPIEMIQNSKKTWTKTYVQNETVRTALDAYVDTQTAFVKQIVANADAMTAEISKEVGKFPKFDLMGKKK
jgi:hypothetical protein